MTNPVDPLDYELAKAVLSNTFVNKSLIVYRRMLAEFICAMNEMDGYGEQWTEWSGDGPDWLRRLSTEAAELLRDDTKVIQ